MIPGPRMARKTKNLFLSGRRQRMGIPLPVRPVNFSKLPYPSGTCLKKGKERAAFSPSGGIGIMMTPTRTAGGRSTGWSEKEVPHGTPADQHGNPGAERVPGNGDIASADGDRGGEKPEGSGGYGPAEGTPALDPGEAARYGPRRRVKGGSVRVARKAVVFVGRHAVGEDPRGVRRVHVDRRIRQVPEAVEHPVAEAAASRISPTAAGSDPSRSLKKTSFPVSHTILRIMAVIRSPTAGSP